MVEDPTVTNSTSIRPATSRPSVRRCLRTTSCKTPSPRRPLVSTRSGCSSSPSVLGRRPSGCSTCTRRRELVDIDESAEMLAAASMDVFADLRVSRLQNPLPEGNFDFVVSALTVHDLDSAQASLATIKEAHSRDCVRLRAVPPLANAIGNLRRADPKDATTNERLIRSTLECSRWPGERAHQVIAVQVAQPDPNPAEAGNAGRSSEENTLCVRKDHSISLIATYHTSDGLGQELGVCPAGDTYSGIAGVDCSQRHEVPAARASDINVLPKWLPRRC